MKIAHHFFTLFFYILAQNSIFFFEEEKKLCGSKYLFWDNIKRESGILFDCENNATLYLYNYEGKRIFYEFNYDEVYNKIIYSLNSDTLVLNLFPNYSESYKIMHTSKDTLTLKRLDKELKSILQFVVSEDQITFPINAPLKDPNKVHRIPLIVGDSLFYINKDSLETYIGMPKSYVLKKLKHDNITGEPYRGNK